MGCIERELLPAPHRVKKGINFCLVWIGLHLPEYKRSGSSNTSLTIDHGWQEVADTVLRFLDEKAVRH